jgi:hypothetical protein
VKEKDLEAQCGRYVEQLWGGCLLKIQGRAHWPDRLVMLPTFPNRPPVILLVEFKRPGATVSPEQAARLQALATDLGVDAGWVSSRQQFFELLDDAGWGIGHSRRAMERLLDSRERPPGVEPVNPASLVAMHAQFVKALAVGFDVA